MDMHLQNARREWTSEPSPINLSRLVIILMRNGLRFEAFQLMVDNDPDMLDEFTQDGYPSLLPPNWRVRREIPSEYSDKEARFELEHLEEGWQVVDYAYANTLGGFETRREARDVMWFARKYVGEHGDIDLGSFPYSLDQPLNYSDVEQIIQWWTEDYP